MPGMTIGQTIGVDQINEMVDTNSVTALDPVWAIVSIIVGVVLGRILRGMTRRYGRKASLAPNIIDLIGTVVLWTTVGLGVVIALSFIGFTIAPLLLFLILVTVILVVGGRTLLENFGAGVLLQARAPFEPGDQVVVNETVGDVVEVNSRVVVIETVDHRRVYLPNTEVLDSAIVNLTHDTYRMGMVLVEVAYGSDLEQTLEVVRNAAKGSAGVLDSPDTVAEVREFQESGVRVRVRFPHRSDVLSEWSATDAVARSVYRAIRDAGITIPFPQRTLWWGGDPPVSEDGAHGPDDPPIDPADG